MMRFPSRAIRTSQWSIEEDHGARVFVDGGFVRYFFYVNIEDGPSGKIDSLGVHQVAFEENSTQQRFSETPSMVPAAFLIESTISSP